MGITASEVLILDTNTFIDEIGFTSRDGSALKHYLYNREMQLVVPEVVAKECERHLTKRAREKRQRIEGDLQWLARFLGKVNGWKRPSDETISERAKVVGRPRDLGTVIVSETPEVRQRAKLRNQAEQPPSHKSAQLADCLIWEQCLDLLAKHDVVFVSADGDFRGHRQTNNLHPTLRAEADEVTGNRNLTFHRTMGSLLSELKSEIQPIPDNEVFTFVYESIASVIEELASNSGCCPKEVGEVKQRLFTTDRAGVIEVRLEITDKWESSDKAKTMDFSVSGLCHYRLKDNKLCNLIPSRVRLLTQQSDGPVSAVEGSFVNISGIAYTGAPPIQPEPEELGHA